MEDRKVKKPAEVAGVEPSHKFSCDAVQITRDGSGKVIRVVETTNRTTYYD